MTLSRRMMMAAAGNAARLYVEDVFSAYLYTGNSSSPHTITNGINLSTKGGMVWIKGRSGATDNALYDTVRGATYDLVSNSTAAQTTQATGVTAFNSTGFSVGTLAKLNTSADTYVSWTFREAPKFFDVVTYTGNGANRTITHGLGSAPGMIAIKRTDSTSPWTVYHRSLANTEYLVLDTTAAVVTSATTYWNSTTADATTFALGTSADVNTNTATYVAYLFAHDTTSDGLIQCGTFTTDASGNASVTLGWEIQYLMIKSSNTVGSSWQTYDAMRGIPVDTPGSILYPNLSIAEYSASIIHPNSTGFTVTNGGASYVYVYLAIRRGPMKLPTVGTQVYNSFRRVGTAADAAVTGVGFPPDLIVSNLSALECYGALFDRLRGGSMQLRTNQTTAESTQSASITSLGQDGYIVGIDNVTNSTNGNTSSPGYINHFFRRAPGFMDEVCDIGTGAAHTISHNLGAVPELMIRKGRSGATDWQVYHSGIANTEKLVLNTSAAKATDTTSWNSTTPSSTTFTVGTGANVNTSTATYVTYLFATKTGISKVGSYTGNGSNQTIDCGFSAGARFILIKRTDSTGDWYVWDTVRGIVAGNDPHLSLNSIAAEVTSNDSIDSDNSGFIVNQLAATDINVTSATYIFLAIA